MAIHTHVKNLSSENLLLLDTWPLPPLPDLQTLLKGCYQLEILKSLMYTDLYPWEISLYLAATPTQKYFDDKYMHIEATL